MTSHIIAVFIGGGLGACSRFLLSLAIADAFSGKQSLPVGTMICNISGCFIIGLVAAIAVGSSYEQHPFFRHLLIVGFLGGFTTFSTFSLETITLLQAGKTGAAMGSAVGTVALCLLGVTLGSALGNYIRTHTHT